MLAVGDASGDAYAADFVRALRELRPNLRALGLGGEYDAPLVDHLQDLVARIGLAEERRTCGAAEL